MSNPALQLVEATRNEDDPALLARARAGEPEAIEQLVRRYLKDVYAVTARVLGDRDLAQDAAHDAMVNALNALHRFRGDASFRTWLIRIAVNAARTVGRRATRRGEVPLDRVSEHAADAGDAATLVAARDDAARATVMLNQLPHKQRLAVTLRVQQGLSYREIGVVLDCTEGAARVNYHLGVKRLRELMK
ncbi:MAG: RNA polymerase sigma factor [Gemmatimonadota bacterium]